MARGPLLHLASGSVGGSGHAEKYLKRGHIKEMKRSQDNICSFRS